MDCYDNLGIGSGFGTGIVVPIVAQNQQINNLLQQGYQFILKKSFNDVNFETLTDTIRVGYRGCHTREEADKLVVEGYELVVRSCGFCSGDGLKLFASNENFEIYYGKIDDEKNGYKIIWKGCPQYSTCPGNKQNEFEFESDVCPKCGRHLK